MPDSTAPNSIHTHIPTEPLNLLLHSLSLLQKQLSVPYTQYFCTGGPKPWVALGWSPLLWVMLQTPKYNKLIEVDAKICQPC